jgi:uncharacterized protein (DUF1501 family)
MQCDYACGSVEHSIARRQFLGGLAAGAAGLTLGGGASWIPVAAAEKLARSQKRILTFWLRGGLSQLESWDPKPNTIWGGPFRSIATSVPDLRISELLPHTAKQMHRLGLVRGLNTKNESHQNGTVQMQTGHSPIGAELPHLGAVAAKALTPASFSLPGHIFIKGAGGGGGSRGGAAAYLGPRFAAVALEDGKAPQYSQLPSTLTAELDARRQEFRRLANDRFAGRRRTADTDAYTYSYEQALDLMARRDVFDVTKESARDQDLYGPSEFGKHCLLARRLLEQGVPFVQVNHADYDTHYENFDFHIEQLGEFDQPFATLVNDLYERGMLDDTLIIVMSEMGRTPRINSRYGRDHWGRAWSVLVGGAGIQRGAVVGKTSADGTEVVDGEVDHGNLFHTYLQAVGLDSKSEFVIGGRKFPLADPSKGPIAELLA